MSYLSGLMRPEQVHMELRARDKPGVLKELVELVPELEHEPVTRESFLKALLERERMHTTAIGEGIALPHARNPLGGLLTRPLLVFGRHAQGVEFGALDRHPVHLFFLLAAPQLTDHLAMLARLSRVLRDPKTRAALLAMKKRNELAAVLDAAELRSAR